MKAIAEMIMEVKQTIAKTLNESGLHPELISRVMKEMYEDSLIAAQNQAAYEKEQYLKEMEDKKKEQSKDTAEEK